MRIHRPGAALLLWLTVALGACSAEPSRLAHQEFAITAEVEQWRELVEKYFKYQHVTWALNIIECESGGKPNAYNSSSGASGLFQHLASYWPPRATAAGFPGAGPFEPEPNIAAAAYLLYESGPGQWECSYSPYENFSYQPQFYKDGVPLTTIKDAGAVRPPTDAGATLTPKKDAGPGSPAADRGATLSVDASSALAEPEPFDSEEPSLAPRTGILQGGCSLTGSSPADWVLLFALAPLQLLHRRRQSAAPRLSLLRASRWLMPAPARRCLQRSAQGVQITEDSRSLLHKNSPSVASSTGTEQV